MGHQDLRNCSTTAKGMTLRLSLSRMRISDGVSTVTLGWYFTLRRTSKRGARACAKACASLVFKRFRTLLCLGSQVRRRPKRGKNTREVSSNQMGQSSHQSASISSSTSFWCEGQHYVLLVRHKTAHMLTRSLSSLRRKLMKTSLLALKPRGPYHRRIYFHTNIGALNHVRARSWA